MSIYMLNKKYIFSTVNASNSLHMVTWRPYLTTSNFITSFQTCNQMKDEIRTYVGIQNLLWLTDFVKKYLPFKGTMCVFLQARRHVFPDLEVILHKLFYIAEYFSTFIINVKTNQLALQKVFIH